ncbi:MAG: ParB/RepB/Spo0J family partition protein [Oscillospiraceae bacterium]|nr:ParB/RepB/Spo0J family partition protein [Oscillospiraceae bacterium]
MNGIINLSVELLEPHPQNPRKELGDLTELSESIKENGIMQNLTVVPFENEAGTRYRVIIGHRRLAASKAAGLAEVPCAVVDMDEKTQLSTMLLENIQRSDLTAFEQAQGFQLMIDLGDTVSEVAKRTGFSESTIRKRLKLAELDQDGLKKAIDNQISMSELFKLDKIEDIKERNRLLRDIGTSNFNWQYEKSLKKQEVAKILPQVKKDLRAMGAKQIKGSQT